jgi:histidinol-phosphate aminotransferase
MGGWDALVRPELRGHVPYRPGALVEALEQRRDRDRVLRLNWNEELAGPLPGVAAAARAAVADAWAYPARTYGQLRAAAAAYAGADPDEVVLGHGIQALVSTLLSVLVRPGATIVVPVPTYGLYAQASAAAGGRVVTVPCRGARLDPAALAAAAREHRARLVWVCDPNNPTGATMTPGEWAALRDALPEDCVIAADEAYGEYVDPERPIDRVAEVRAGAPVVVLRTFSKVFGLAGLRLGYAVADERLARYLDVVQEPFNVNCVALAAGLASLERTELVADRRLAAARSRALLTQRLEAAGMACAPSQANFVLVWPGVDGAALAEAAAARGVLVRPGGELGVPDAVRVTLAPEPQMERAAAVLVAARAAVRGAA